MRALARAPCAYPRIAMPSTRDHLRAIGSRRAPARPPARACTRAPARARLHTRACTRAPAHARGPGGGAGQRRTDRCGGGSIAVCAVCGCGCGGGGGGGGGGAPGAAQGAAATAAAMRSGSTRRAQVRITCTIARLRAAHASPRAQPPVSLALPRVCARPRPARRSSPHRARFMAPTPAAPRQRLRSGAATCCTGSTHDCTNPSHHQVPARRAPPRCA